MQETPVQFLGQEDLLKRDRLPTSVFLGFSDGSAGKESTCIVRDLSSIPRLERSPGEGNNYPLQYSGLENSRESDTTDCPSVNPDVPAFNPGACLSSLLINVFFRIFPAEC